jgi:urease accessory protein
MRTVECPPARAKIFLVLVRFLIGKQMDFMNFIRMIHIADSGYPTGSFAHSCGLECAIHNRWVTDSDSLFEWALDAVKFSLLPLDARAARRSRCLVTGNGFETGELVKLNDEYVSFKPSETVRNAGSQIGRSFVNITCDAYVSEPVRKLKDLISMKDDLNFIQYPVAWGLICGIFSIPAEEMISVFILNTVRQWANVAIKIIPLGQKDAHIFITRMFDPMKKMIEKELENDMELESISPGFDISSMGHDSLHARYFRT